MFRYTVYSIDVVNDGCDVCLPRVQVEAGYRPNPYHNATHAADVLQTLHVILHRGGLVPHYADPLLLLAAYLAAVVHDYEHGGLTNVGVPGGGVCCVMCSTVWVVLNLWLWLSFTCVLRAECADGCRRSRGVRCGGPGCLIILESGCLPKA